MKRLALLLASAAFVNPALAADVIYEEPAAPAPVVIAAPAALWTGFYVGGQAVIAFNADDEADIFFDPDNNGVGDDFDLFDEDENAGLIGGVHAGYDYQAGNFVFSVQVDVSYIDAEVNRVIAYTDGFGRVFQYGTTQEIDWIGTARLKAGVAADRLMVYATGGLAYADLETTFWHPDDGLDYRVTGDEDDFGYTVGAGVDFLVSQNFSIGLEYLYTDLGDNDTHVEAWTTGPNARLIGTGDFNDDFDFHTVWAKASFRFN